MKLKKFEHDLVVRYGILKEGKKIGWTSVDEIKRKHLSQKPERAYPISSLRGK
jgi:hypothetical protein